MITKDTKISVGTAIAVALLVMKVDRGQQANHHKLDQKIELLRNDHAHGQKSTGDELARIWSAINNGTGDRYSMSAARQQWHNFGILNPSLEIPELPQ